MKTANSVIGVYQYMENDPFLQCMDLPLSVSEGDWDPPPPSAVSVGCYSSLLLCSPLDTIRSQADLERL